MPPPSAGSRQAEAPETEQGSTAHPIRRSNHLFFSESIGLICWLADAACWSSAYVLMFTLRHHAGYAASRTEGADFQTSVCLVQFVVLVVCLYIVGGYDRRTNFLSLNYMSEHCITLLAAAVIGGLLIYAGAAYTQAIRPSRGVFLSSLAAFAPLSLLTRRSLRVALHAHFARSYFVVLGTGPQARHFYRSYLASPNRERLRFVDPSPTGPEQAPAVHGLDDAPRIEADSLSRLAALAAGSSGIIVAESAHRLPNHLMDWLTRLHYEETPVYTLETFYERHWRRVPVQAIDLTWPLQMGSQLTSVSPYSHAKRLLDIFAAAAGLLLLGPLFLGLALLVALESGRPVLFRQPRVGRNRQPFSLLKFRTMHVRTEAHGGSLYTVAKDPRITRVGAYLRKLRLDELPQLWNVLRGDMSLIGPRAEWDRLVDRYEKAIPCYHFRHLVKPGITGWAQVNYPYGASEEDALQKLKYDLYYIRHYSLRLDAMIVLKTLHVMIWGKGR